MLLSRAMTERSSTRSTTEETRLRYYRRSEEPTLPFVWWGLLPLLLLLGTFLFGLTWFAGSIEEAVAQDTRAALRAEGFDEVTVVADGQAVHLSGLTEAERDRAVQVAESVRSGSMFGALVSPIEVTADADLAQPDPAPDLEPAPEPEEPATPPAPAPWADVTAALREGVLVLSGEVESQLAKSRIGAAAEGAIDAPRITRVQNDLRVARQPVRAGSTYLALRAAHAVGECSRGQARVLDGVFSMSCLVPADHEQGAHDIAEAAVDHGRLGSIRILPAEAVDECERAFTDLLRGRTIRFAVGSAALRASSRRLLDRVAETARTCPGTLRVEGHTDDTGELDANMRLSRERAQSVIAALVERGIEAGRLIPEGLGPTRPRAEGTSAAARTQNRRIEFHVTLDDANNDPSQSDSQ